jgi:hypothetical protein
MNHCRSQGRSSPSHWQQRGQQHPQTLRDFRGLRGTLRAQFVLTMHMDGQEETSENELLKRFTKQIQSHKTYQKPATMIIPHPVLSHFA